MLWSLDHKRLLPFILIPFNDFLFVTEEGLKTAQIATEAMYESTLDRLGQLSHKDIAVIFKGATLKEMVMQPGLSVLDFALSAGCFNNEGNYTLHYSLLLFSIIVVLCDFSCK